MELLVWYDIEIILYGTCIAMAGGALRERDKESFETHK